jgi:hypothetical protein
MPTAVPVLSLIPTIREVTATSTSALDQLTAIKDVMSTPGRRWQLGQFILNGSNQVTALILEYGSMQLCLRATSTTQLLCSLHPEGGVTDANNPVTPTGTTERSINAYTGGTNLLPLTDRRIQIAELEGVISIMFRNSTGVWVAGIHAGQIYYADNLSDEVKGFDGMGILIGRPGAWANNTSISPYFGYGRSMWLTWQVINTLEASFTGSVVRVAGGEWVVPTFRNLVNQFATPDANGFPNEVNGIPRMQPVEIVYKSFTPIVFAPGTIGCLRFVRQVGVFPIQIQDSDQFWSSNYLKYTTTSTSDPRSYDIRNLVFVWNKNYTA